MVVHAPSAKAKLHVAGQKVLKIRQPIAAGVGEEQLAVEHLRKQLIEVDADKLPAHRQRVRTLDPAQVLDEVVVVLGLILICGWGGSELKTGCAEGKFVDCAGQVARWPIDAHVVGAHRIHVDAAVIDVNQPEAKIIDQLRAEDVGFGNTEEAIVDRKLVRKIQIRAAGRRAQRSLQTARPEGNVPFCIRKEESRGNRVARAPELMVPVRGELIIGKFSRPAYRQLHGRTRLCPGGGIGQREQISIAGCSELTAPEGQ